MKVPPKRKGNTEKDDEMNFFGTTLNESPSEKEGKSRATHHRSLLRSSLNESPSEKEGKFMRPSKQRGFE